MTQKIGLDQVLESQDQITPEWLTQALRKSGVLTHGTVQMVEIDARERELSTTYRLRIAYPFDAQGFMPARLFLKTVNADQEEEFFGPSEVDYYRRDYVGLACAPLLRCYDGAFSAEQRRYHLLLDDVSSSHVEARTKAPTLAYGLVLAESLACLHTHRWGSERIAETGDRLPDAARINRFVEVARPGAGYIIEAMSDQLEPHWPAAINELLARHPQAMIDRTRDPQGFTLIHGDANRTNILVPREGERPLYIIDRQPFDWSLTVWLGVYDLAYAVVLDWDTAARRRHEVQLLRHYYEQLGARGVEGYSWERLYDDYRLSMAICVYVAIEWCRGGINHEWTHVWLPKLQRSLTACDDLNCRELWT